MFQSDHKCFQHQIKHTAYIDLETFSKNVFESRCLYCGKKTGNSGGSEVIWEFDDRLKIEQVRDMNRVVRLRNSVIHVLPAPLSPCQKRFHALRADVIHAHTCQNPQSTQKGVTMQSKKQVIKRGYYQNAIQLPICCYIKILCIPILLRSAC